MILLFMFSCSWHAKTIYYVDTKYDEFDERTTNLMRGNILGCMDTWSTEVSLDIWKIMDKDNITLYSLVATDASFGSQAIYFRDGESLKLLVDGERFVYSGNGGERSAIYVVSVEDIIKISNAQEVKVKLESYQGDIVRCYSMKNFENFKRFINEYVKPSELETNPFLQQ